MVKNEALKVYNYRTSESLPTPLMAKSILLFADKLCHKLQRHGKIRPRLPKENRTTCVSYLTNQGTIKAEINPSPDVILGAIKPT